MKKALISINNWMSFVSRMLIPCYSDINTCVNIYIYIFIYMSVKNNFLHITCIVKLGACMATNNESKPVPKTCR